MSSTATATTPASTRIPAGTWRIDPLHSTVGFEVKHLGISTFRGRFTDFEGRVVAGEEGLESVNGRIRTESIDIADEQLGGHLRSPDFFDVANHPEARFESTSVEANGDGYALRGDFTLRGVTRPVELTVRVEGVGVDAGGNDRVSLYAEGVLDRTEYGISWNSTLANGALAVAEDVRLVLSVEAVLEETN